MPLLDGDAVDVTALAYASGEAPRASGLMRESPADFRVDEDCPILPCGEGEHLWCRVEKTGLTTPEALEMLSRAAGIHPRHIGFAGLKDKHAVTTQWFSLAWPIKQALPGFDGISGLRVLECTRHERKLKRGAHAGNRFLIRVRQVDGASAAEIAAAVGRIVASGVPNYFGVQRFGQGGRNLALSRALFAGKRLSRNRRGFALSAARSLLFNAVLDARVRAGTWNQPVAGDAMMLAGSHSIFAWDAAGQSANELTQRMAAFDIHPTGPLPGRESENLVSGQARALEEAVMADYADLRSGLVDSGVDAARRALRLPVPDLRAELTDGVLALSFSLPSGAFATSVLRELVTTRERARG